MVSPFSAIYSMLEPAFKRLTADPIRDPRTQVAIRESRIMTP